MIRYSCFTAATIFSLIVGAQSAQADLDTNPDLFTVQSTSPTGQFFWDEFTGSFAGPHAPDVVSSGGTGVLTAFSPATMPPGLVTSTQNLYGGNDIGVWDIDLSGLSVANVNTTVVLQIASQENLDLASILLDGAVPSTLVDRGTAEDVLHDIDGMNAPADTHYYWAEWQVAANASYNLEFTAAGPHLSIAAASVDYFNTGSGFSATPAELVPEPSSLLLCGLGACCTAFAGLRRRRLQSTRS